MTLDIRLHEDHGKGAFTARVGDREVAKMTFTRVNPGLIIVDHTETFPGFEGRGVGADLVAHGVQWARDRGQQIMPLCPFARSMFERTPAYADVWFR